MSRSSKVQMSHSRLLADCENGNAGIQPFFGHFTQRFLDFSKCA